MKILAGTSKGVFSIEGGEPRHVLESREVLDLSAASDRLFAGTGSGFFISEDVGESWSLVGLEDREVWQVRHADADVVYASTYPAALFRSDDAGITWAEVESFANVPVVAESCFPGRPELPGRARALVIDRNDPRRMWVGVEIGGIMRTVDGGETWQSDAPGGNPDLHMMFAHPGRPEVLFASTGYGRLNGLPEYEEDNTGVFRSDDCGATWQYAWHGITPRYSRPMCIDPRPPYGLTVVSAPRAFSNFRDVGGGAQAMLFRSEDGGESWRSLCDPAHSPSREAIHGLTSDAEQPGGVVIGTETGEVWRVSNDGDWTPVSSGMPAVLSVIAL
jgi:photosystem II stability/assembly factor-like uncharacterized protein